MGRRGVAVDAHAAAVWVFELLTGVGSLPPESQSYAAEVYAQVTEKMLPEITEAVAKGYDVFQSALRCKLSGALADELQQGWLLQNYVQCVAIVVERAARSVYTFEPEVALHMLPVGERARASDLYERVDGPAAEDIGALVN